MLWRFPGREKHIGDGTSKTRMRTWLPGSCFRALAKSSAGRPSIIVAIGRSMSRVRWSMVKKRKKTTRKSACDCAKAQPLIIYKPASFEELVSETRCRYRFALRCFRGRGCTAAEWSGCSAGKAKKSSHPWHFRCWSLRRNELDCTDLVHWTEALHHFRHVMQLSFLVLCWKSTLTVLMRKRKVEGRGRGKERKRMRKKERKRKGKREREIGSEALAETEKIANTPAGNRTRDPSKRGWCSTIKPPRQATSPASLFEILSVLPPLHNIGIIQCPQTKPASLGEPVTVAIVHRARPERIVIKGINAKSEILMRKRKVEGRGRGKERKRMRKKERKRKGKREREIGKWSFGRNGKNRKRPSRESNPGPQQTRLMLYH